MKNIILGTLSLFLILISCNESNDIDEYIDTEYDIISRDLNLPQETFDYTIQFPEALSELSPIVEIDPETAALNNHKATLGRVLFYDQRLSKNNTVSCASCHIQERAFADNLRASEGFDGQEVTRNSLALATTLGFEASYGGEGNVDFLGHPGVRPPEGLAQFSWDDSVVDLHEQSRRAITSEVEMGMTMQEVVKRVQQEQFYGILFKNAFGHSQISEFEVLEALRSFINAISSTHSKFDKALADMGNGIDAHQNFIMFTPEENQGKTLFNRDCASCHGDIHSFTVAPIANNGLDLEYQDHGKGAVTGNDFEMDVFKVPFLRNIALTAPYMHDGRFATLSDVIDHYSTDIKDHPNLDHRLRGASDEAKRFNYSPSEKNALIAYLHTLTDEEILTDERFSNPFK